jgi:NADPH-dependent 2,4-dienoyl-CoA reductase/sulfur reductase-like enzyme
MPTGPVRRVVVVGAGLGGLRTAEELRSLGYDGELTLVGAERHPPYSRPPLSKEVLRGEAAPESAHLRDAAALAGIELRLGRHATGLDVAGRTVWLDNGRALPYDAAVIATGATPRTLPGVDAAAVHVLRTIDDAVSLRDRLSERPRVAVIGAGFIGSEVASSARQLGCEVTVVELLPAPLVQCIGPTIAPACAALQQAAGVDLRCGVGVDVVADGKVKLSDGTSVAADVVVVGIGVRPELGWLHDSGLTIDDGLVCDETCRTSAPGVYAVGDVARWHNPRYGEHMRLEHWTNATEQAAAVARNLLGETTPFAPVPYFWSDQFDAKIQVLGAPRADDEVQVVRGALDGGKFVAVYGRAGRLTGVVGLSSARQVMSLRPLLSDGTAYDDAIAHAKAS